MQGLRDKPPKSATQLQSCNLQEPVAYRPDSRSFADQVPSSSDLQGSAKMEHCDCQIRVSTSASDRPTSFARCHQRVDVDVDVKDDDPDAISVAVQFALKGQDPDVTC